VIGLTLSAYNVSLDAFGKLKDVLSTVGNAPLFRPAGANQGSPTLSLNAYTPGINVDAGAHFNLPVSGSLQYNHGK